MKKKGNTNNKRKEMEDKDTKAIELLKEKYKDLNEELVDDILGVLPQYQQGNDAYPSVCLLAYAKP